MARQAKEKGLGLDLEDYDVSSMDPALFEDPVLLLEYLQGLDSQSKTPVSDHIHSKKQNAESQNDYLTKRRFPVVSGLGSRASQNDSSKKTISHHSIPFSAITRLDVIYGYEKYYGKIRICQKEAEAILTIITLHDAGYGDIQIADKLRNTKYRTVMGKKFYPGAIKAIIDKRDIYEGNTGYPPILVNNAQRKNADQDFRHQVEKKRDTVVAEPSKLTDDNTIKKKVERVLRQTKGELNIYAIQNITGINDLDGIIDALEQLIKSGEVVRTWSRKNGGRSVYSIKKLKNEVDIQSQSTIDNRSPAKTEKASFVRESNAEGKENTVTQKSKGEVSFNAVYRDIDEFLYHAKEMGIRTKDNRSNDGCVWVQSSLQIDIMIVKVQVKDRKFKFASKCRAFDGDPGWYY